jgi:arylsulfatase A-like enzyme
VSRAAGWSAALAGALLLAACGDGTPARAPGPRDPTAVGGGTGASGAGDPASPPTGGAPSEPPAPPALLPAPRLDLAANHVRFQLHDRGLVIPIGAEGIRPYDLDYKRGWGDVVTVAGAPARKLRGKTASLTAPWPGGAGKLTLRAHGATSIKVAIDGKAAGAVALAAGASAWATGELELPAGLAAGEHKLGLTPDKKGAALASVELVPAGGAATGCAGDPLPRAALADDGALGGWPRMAIVVEVPAHGFLVVTPSGGGDAAITLRPEFADAPHTLWSGTADGEPLHLELAAHAGKLAELAFTGGCAVRWQGAAIAVAARTVADAEPPAKNVILVVVDTLRADRVAAMGMADSGASARVTGKGTRVETPRWTALAARGAAFRNHQSMAPSSPPSHASIQTGQIPRVHGVIADDHQVDPDAPLLSRVIRDAGLFTGYVGDNDFAMGRLKKLANWSEAHAPVFEGKGPDCVPVFEGVVAMVKKARASGQRYFISALPIQPHAPYRYHAGITEKYFAGPFAKPLGKRVVDLQRVKSRGLTPVQWEQFRGLYDGEVEYVDSTCYAILEDGLAELGATDDTAILITSDHGEGMGERGKNAGHAYSLNRELISVPLIISGPGIGTATIDTITSAADVAPTVIDLLGLPVDPRMQGQSLLPLARTGDVIPRIIASEYGRAYALRGSHYRYIVGYDDKGHLYDIDADPAETKDVNAEAPLALRYLRTAAGLYLAHRNAWRAPTWGNLADLAPGGPLAKP